MDRLQARAQFATRIQRQAQIRSAALIEGLATVPREDFMGPGPWKTMRSADMAKGYQPTPDNNPLHLYDDVLVALDEPRRLNNGEPQAQWLDQLAIGGRLLVPLTVSLPAMRTNQIRAVGFICPMSACNQLRYTEAR